MQDSIINSIPSQRTPLLVLFVFGDLHLFLMYRMNIVCIPTQGVILLLTSPISRGNKRLNFQVTTKL